MLATPTALLSCLRLPPPTGFARPLSVSRLSALAAAVSCHTCAIANKGVRMGWNGFFSALPGLEDGLVCLCTAFQSRVSPETAPTVVPRLLFVPLIRPLLILRKVRRLPTDTPRPRLLRLRPTQTARDVVNQSVADVVASGSGS